MKLDLMNIFYTGSMIFLLFGSAILLTTIITKYVEKRRGKEKNSENKKI
jgi:hypothetical protein